MAGARLVEGFTGCPPKRIQILKSQFDGFSCFNYLDCSLISDIFRLSTRTRLSSFQPVFWIPREYRYPNQWRYLPPDSHSVNMAGLLLSLSYRSLQSAKSWKGPAMLLIRNLSHVLLASNQDKNGMGML